MRKKAWARSARPMRKKSARPMSHSDCGITVGVARADWLRDPETQDCCTTLQPWRAISPKKAMKRASPAKSSARRSQRGKRTYSESMRMCARSRSAAPSDQAVPRARA
jgi:hypothetical protein